MGPTRASSVRVGPGRWATTDAGQRTSGALRTPDVAGPHNATRSPDTGDLVCRWGWLRADDGKHQGAFRGPRPRSMRWLDWWRQILPCRCAASSPARRRGSTVSSHLGTQGNPGAPGGCGHTPAPARRSNRRCPGGGGEIDRRGRRCGRSGGSPDDPSAGGPQHQGLHRHRNRTWRHRRRGAGCHPGVEAPAENPVPVGTLGHQRGAEEDRDLDPSAGIVRCRLFTALTAQPAMKREYKSRIAAGHTLLLSPITNSVVSPTHRCLGASAVDCQDPRHDVAAAAARAADDPGPAASRAQARGRTALRWPAAAIICDFGRSTSPRPRMPPWAS